MPGIKQSYRITLEEFIRLGSEEVLYKASVLARAFLLKKNGPEEVVALHYEVLRELTSHFDAEEALAWYDLSLFFLLQVMVDYSVSSYDSENQINQLHSMMAKIRKLQSQQQVYEKIFSYHSTGVLTYDREGYITFVNPVMTQFIGCTERQLLGQDFATMRAFPGASVSLIDYLQSVWKNLSDGTKDEWVQEHIDVSGRYLSVTGNLTEEQDGLFSVRDRSEYRKMEQSIFQTEKLAMMGKIAASVAHEIRNPLTAVKGFIQLLKPDFEKLGKSQYVTIILSELDRVHAIIQEFLSSSKPTVPKKEVCDLGNLIQDVILLVQSEALMRNCELIYETSSEIPILMLDSKQIKQVVLNMIRNALDAIEGRPGRIHLSVISDRDDWIQLVIQDNGKGIDESTKDRLFDPFFTTKEKGTGLGLSVCNQIIENHAGSILVESEPGCGTSFTIQLPVTGEASQPSRLETII